MKRPLLVPAVLALAGGFSLAACSERFFAPVAESEATQLLLSHSPAHHGVDGAAQLTSTPPDYTELAAAAATGRGGAVHLMVQTAGAIPRLPDDYISSVAVFGYAWVDTATGHGIVVVMHPAIGRDSRQNPDGWHSHPVELTAGTGSSDFCVVSIGRTQGGIAIVNDAMRVNMADQWAGIAASDLDVSAAFFVQEDTGCSATGLGVALLDTEGL